MTKSEQINELAGALAKAQGEIKGALKDANNPFFKSKYADLASVVEAIRAPLSKNGLSYVQLTEPSEKEEVRVETILMHSSGQWIGSVLALPVSKADAQGFGSALTYARRYGLSAAVGVAPEDDDGNAATVAKPTLAEPDAEGRRLLEECGSLSALTAAWGMLTKEQRRTLNEVKERCKARIEQADREAAAA